MSTTIKDYVRKLDNANTTEDKINIITEVTSDNDVHVFGELLSDPRLASLESEAPDAHRLLRLFAYGTYAEYTTTGQPELSPRQLRKLRRLSVVQAARTRRSIDYASLLDGLGLSGVPELESLLAEMITLGLLQGKLDQRNQLLQVHSCMGRDVPPEELPRLVEALESWLDACRGSLGLVCAEMEAAEARHAAAQLAKRQVEERVESERAKAHAQRDAGPNSGAPGASAAAAAAAAVAAVAATGGGPDAGGFGEAGGSVKPLKKSRLSAKK